MNNCCKFNWFSTFVLHKNKTSVIQGLIKIALDNKSLVQNEIEIIEKAVELIEENEKLKQEIKNLKYIVQYLTDYGSEKEERYKKALRKVGPAIQGNFWLCSFCDMPYYNSHTDDCEYVRLCGSDINVTTKDGGA